MRVPTNSPQRDWSDIASLQREMMEAADSLAAMGERVARARQVKDFDSERRRSALSCQVSKLLGDHSAAAAEHMARSSEGYHKAMAELSTQLFLAEKELVAWESTKIKWESLRSVLSMAKHVATSI